MEWNWLRSNTPLYHWTSILYRAHTLQLCSRQSPPSVKQYMKRCFNSISQVQLTFNDRQLLRLTTLQVQLIAISIFWKMHVQM